MLKRLAQDLTAQRGRGFSECNLENMRNLYLGWKISQTPSAKFEARARTKGAALTNPALAVPAGDRAPYARSADFCPKAIGYSV